MKRRKTFAKKIANKRQKQPKKYKQYNEGIHTDLKNVRIFVAIYLILLAC